jgi:hypothetical protein
MRAAARRHRTAGNSEEQDYFPRAARGAAQTRFQPGKRKARSRVHTRGLQVELSAVDALLMPVHAALLAGSAPIPAARCPIRSPSTSSEEARTLSARQSTGPLKADLPAPAVWVSVDRCCPQSRQWGSPSTRRGPLSQQGGRLEIEARRFAPGCDAACRDRFAE